MSDIDRAELRRLAKAATPRPWVWDDDNARPGLRHGREFGGIVFRCGALYGPAAADAAYVAAAVNVLPDLLDALEKAEGHRDSLAATLIEVQREKLALERVRALHAPGDEWCGYHNSALCECANVYCEACGDSWPCPTIQALDGGE